MAKMAEILFLLTGIVDELSHSSHIQSMRPLKRSSSPSTKPSDSPNALSICFLMFPLLVALQILWILSALQRGFSHLNRVVSSEALGLVREAETQAQIMITFFYLFGTRLYPGLLRGIGRPMPVAQAKEHLVKLTFLLPLEYSRIYAISLSIPDLAVSTIIFSRFCLPQSTSLFTNPCRPFTSPFPQCQDLLHTPPTYVMTFWVVSSFIFVIPATLEWFEGAISLSIQFAQWRRLSFSNSTCSLLVRVSLFILCLNFAFGETHPGSPYWDPRPSLFSPTASLIRWLFSILIGSLLTISALRLRLAISHLGAGAYLRAFILLIHNRSKYQPHYYQIALASLHKAPNISKTSHPHPPSGYQPAKIAKSGAKTYTFKRSPLTQHTFKPPLPLLGPLESADAFDTQRATAILHEALNTVELAGVPITRLDIIDPRSLNAESIIVVTSADASLAGATMVLNLEEKTNISLESRSTTPSPTGNLPLDSSDEDRSPPIRPASRLGFNAEELASRWSNSRILDGELETVGAAAMLYRHPQQQAWSPPTREPIPSLTLDPPPRSIWPAVPSPLRTPLNQSRSSSPPSPGNLSTSEGDCEGWDAHLFSHTGATYDWAAAATSFGDNGRRGEGGGGRETSRIHLARIPDLHTIDEETSDEEPEMGRTPVEVKSQARQLANNIQT